jgi:hypothetical protein
LRNLAVPAQREKNFNEARALMLEAWQLGPRIASLALEVTGLLAEMADHEALEDFRRSLPESMRDHERIRVFAAKAALAAGRPEEVRKLLVGEFSKVREGETSLTDLWFGMHAQLLSRREGLPVNAELLARVRREFPPPKEIDFRTKP